MGSPAASVYFGYDLGLLHDDDLPGWWFDGESDRDGDWEFELATRLGWTWRERPDRRSGQSQSQYTDSPAYQRYQANLARRAAPLESLPVELADYGFTESEPAWAVRATKSVRSVNDAYETLALEPLTIDPAWAQHLTTFIELLELPHPAAGPRWYLNCAFHP
ncbi:hypothetical protein [Nocardia sp. XZ_19_369]|uniref:hypothetical protein n=1 Tax=Nocardia sp. XZ_19_369 TaxID=2769487 RepID=UPI00188F561F|nr:hypothetical protein [Nocardia sp. XZ_19_369]